MIYAGANLKAKSEVIALTNQSSQSFCTKFHVRSSRGGFRPIWTVLLAFISASTMAQKNLNPDTYLSQVTSSQTQNAIQAQIDPRSKTPAIAGGNKGPAGEPSCSIQVVSGFQFEICQEYPAASEIQDNNSITIDGVIDITHETSQAPNPEFRWI